MPFLINFTLELLNSSRRPNEHDETLPWSFLFLGRPEEFFDSPGIPRKVVSHETFRARQNDQHKLNFDAIYRVLLEERLYLPQFESGAIQNSSVMNF